MKKVKSLYRKIVGFIAVLNEDLVSVFAAQSAFFMLLSLFPLIMTLLTLVKYLPITESQAVDILRMLAPEEINSNFDFMFDEIFNTKNTLGVTIVTGIFTVWSASRGGMSIGKGLTFIARDVDSVNYFVRRIIHTCYTLIFCLILVVYMAVSILSDFVVDKIHVRLDHVDGFLDVVLDADLIVGLLTSIKMIIAPAVLFVLVAAAYWILPVRKVNIKTLLPGAAFTTIVWWVISVGISKYISVVGINTYMYGSLAGVILLALWIYMCMYAMLVGAEINKQLDSGGYGARIRAMREKRNKKHGNRKKERRKRG